MKLPDWVFDQIVEQGESCACGPVERARLQWVRFSCTLVAAGDEPTTTISYEFFCRCSVCDISFEVTTVSSDHPYASLEDLPKEIAIAAHTDVARFFFGEQVEAVTLKEAPVEANWKGRVDVA
jgi:hypothetical protein